MAHTMGLRATSFAASAALFGFAVLAAMSVSITLQTIDLGGPAPVPVVTVRPPEPTPITTRDPSPPAPTSEDETIFRPLPEFPPTQTEMIGATILAPPGPAEITDARWMRRPRDLASYYPPRALGREVTGEVVLDCLVTTSGALQCAVASETPPNWGFGAAALRIARDHRMAPAMREGQAVEGRYRMRVPFQVE